jgi:hypothetical protein
MSGPVLFPIAPDWTREIKETTSYLTDVLVGYSDAEQRRGLRSNPRRSLDFTCTTMTALEASLLETTIFGSMQNPLALPWWPDAIRLSGDLPSGSTSIAIDTTTRLFASGGLAVLWRSAFENELVQVTGVAANLLSLGSGTANSWTKGNTFVVPAFLVRLGTSVELPRYSSGGIDAQVTFVGEAGQTAPAFSWTPTQYRGIDVLEVSPNWTSDEKTTLARSLIVLDAKTGDVTVETKSASPIASTPFAWFLADRNAITTLRAFFDRRKGRLAPFFVPSWHQDLILANDVLATDSSITIKGTNYSSILFPFNSRRDLAFLAVTGAKTYARVTGSVQNGDGTETLSLGAPIGTAFSKTRTQVSFLELVRLGSDDLSILWSSSTLASASLSLIEVPREVPA